ncbi:MAG: YybH family protein [Bacteroidota bacterium]
MRTITFLILICSILQAQQNGPAKELADAERAFSAMCEKNGIKESFLHFLADECVMFNPHPVNGRELYKKRKTSPTYLSWYPTFVEVSASGDFGISIGPWELRPSKNDTNTMYGHYFSVWKKMSDGNWKVIIDNGMEYPLSEKRNEKDHIRSLKQWRTKNNGVSSRDQLLELERTFAGVQEKDGMVKAYEQYSSDDLRMHRKGIFPTESKSAVRKMISSGSTKQEIFPVGVQMASSGDIGYTYGYAVGEKNDSSIFVRVWRNDSGWKIAVDLLDSISK